MTSLFGLTLQELQTVARSLSMPNFAAKQMASWLYDKQVNEIDEMTNISLKYRQLLKQDYQVGRMPPVETTCSADGTEKYLYAVGDQQYVESVYIPDDDRATLCVSSQVGCKMNCKFCMTGRMGFISQLNAGQILNQMASLPKRDQLTNMVFMGMGEPMDNVDEVLKALEILTSDYGYGWSPRRITVSTVGIRRGLQRFLDESECHLAISLHAPLSPQRLSLMPVEKAFPAEDIVDLLRGYDFAHQRRLSFEYIMFEGVNDSMADAKALVKLLRGMDCRVNLIRFHAIPDSDLTGSDLTAMTAFRDYLTQHGLFTTIRASRGEDILAACGMLSTQKNNMQ